MPKSKKRMLAEEFLLKRALERPASLEKDGGFMDIFRRGIGSIATGSAARSAAGAMRTYTPTFMKGIQPVASKVGGGLNSALGNLHEFTSDIQSPSVRKVVAPLWKAVDTPGTMLSRNVNAFGTPKPSTLKTVTSDVSPEELAALGFK